MADDGRSRDGERTAAKQDRLEQRALRPSPVYSMSGPLAVLDKGAAPNGVEKEMTRQERYLLNERIFCAPVERQIDAAEQLKVLGASHVVRKVVAVLRHVR